MVEAFVAKSEENIWCVQLLVVVVPNARESVPVVVMGPPVIGYVVAILVTVPEPPTAGVEVAISNPFGSTARNVPAGVPSEVNHTELVAVNCDVLAFPKFCCAVHQCVLPRAKETEAEPGPEAVTSPVRAVM